MAAGQFPRLEDEGSEVSPPQVVGLADGGGASLLDDAPVHKTDRRTTVADREAVEVRVGTVSWGYPPTIFHGFFVPEGTTDHLLLLDAEVGVILRVAARLEDREFYVAEVTEIAFDEEFPEDTFRLELPGVEFQSR